MIRGVNGPPVRLIDTESGTPHIDHRFNGKGHAGDKEHARALMSDIADPGILVKGKTDAVPPDFSDHAVSVGGGVS